MKNFISTIKIFLWIYLIWNSIDCSLIDQTYVDNNDGTISAEMNNLTWAKCNQVDTNGINAYNAAANDCSNGSTGMFKFCDLPLNTCDDGQFLNGTGNSEVYTTCANLTLAGRLWRVPTYEELIQILTDNNEGYLHIPDYFPDNYQIYWTSESNDTVTANTVNFGDIDASFAFILQIPYLKTSNLAVRCVSNGL